MAGEQAEPTLSHSLDRHWKLQLQAIDPSVQVCPGISVSLGFWGGEFWAGGSILALCLRGAQELWMLWPALGSVPPSEIITKHRASATLTAWPVPPLQIRIQRPHVMPPSQPPQQP